MRQSDGVRWLLLAAMLLGIKSASATSDDASELVRKMWERYRGPASERDEIDLLVITAPQASPYKREQAEALLREAQGDVVHKRAVRHVRYADAGRDKLHILFSLPSEDAGLGFLVVLQPEGVPDELSLFMPGYRKVRRVAASNRQRLAGTDLMFEDLRGLLGERQSQFTYASVGRQACAERQCTIIEATPKDAATSIYSRRRLWIDPEWQFPMQVEYYDGDKLWKILRNSDVHEIRPGVRRADLSEMRDVVNKHVTLVLVAKREVGIAVADEVFTEDYLVHPGGE